MNFRIPLLVVILPLVSLSLLGCDTAEAPPEPANGEPEAIAPEPEVSENREDYDEINLAELPPDVQLVGIDPEAIAADLFIPPVPPEEAPEGLPVDDTVTVDSDPEQAVVVVTRLGLPDDSVRGIRYRAEFLPAPEAETPQWQMVWAGSQYLCQPGRGAQDWSSDLCV
ncbi:hypothetical protein GS597_12610 [Synechococcales cyanobacterium C]|uniref:PASTA domain-containing protein n=1 Tax=Petrachloros mirabilis ULC683 TaxID=2781853 RepID=A0A8K2A093_9CYAN|nr:hypothetical protein [Petrachloros mirabilis]NCJ07333.1 hypothetical protein [Petrachloros mirabilis ULC683]